MSDKLYPPIAPGAQETIGFDCGPALVSGATLPGATLTGSPTVTVSVSEESAAQDPNAGPGNILSAPTLVASKKVPAIANGQWNLLMGNFVDGVIYRLECLAPTSDGQILPVITLLECSSRPR